MSIVSLYHLKKAKRAITLKSNHKLATMMMNPTEKLANEILAGDKCLKYQHVADIKVEDPTRRFMTVMNTTQNTNGIWSEKLSPESKYLGSGIPRSSSVGDVLVSDGIAFLVTLQGFLLIKTN